MKKVIRVFVTLLLILAILGSLAWYLLEYDRDFTRDMLLQQARRFESQGNHKLASFFYDVTYAFAENGEDIAIELAQQYKAAGNYTKAEYTLSRAIADGGGTRLYIALCKTYIEQDKLLDAVNMLDNISDAAIKEAIAAMRPETPIVDKKPDFYNQYIDVSVTAPTGKLYVTTDGAYPSTADPQYQGPVTLPQGETTLLALAVADNGLVSKLGVFGYTVGGVVEPVTFTDPAVEAAIREQLEKDADEVLYTNQLWEIKEFVMPREASDYADLQYLTYLESLEIYDSAPEQLLQLSGLNYLHTLSVTDSFPTEQELSVIGSLTALRRLTLVGCSLSTLAPLEGLKQLEYLDCTDNAIRNLTPLSGMTQLQELYLASNALTDLAPLSSLSALQVLDVSYNSLSSLAPIASLSGLQRLYGNNNSISSLEPVKNLVSLQLLNMADNTIAEVTALSGMTQLQELDISHNAITDITALSPLKQLAYFYFADNQVTELPQFGKDAALVSIDGAYNLLTTLEPLSGMSTLNTVLMDYNEEIESVDCLANCHLLSLVSVFGTKVADVSALTDQGILVNFNPTLDK